MARPLALLLLLPVLLAGTAHRAGALAFGEGSRGSGRRAGTVSRPVPSQGRGSLKRCRAPAGSADSPAGSKPGVGTGASRRHGGEPARGGDGRQLARARTGAAARAGDAGVGPRLLRVSQERTETGQGCRDGAACGR